ncbi:MAG: T9SS type A sorting domain-containing protein [Salibacteraceae bacterium]
MNRILILFIFSAICSFTYATNYTFTGPGNYDNSSLWSPSYPGTTIGSSHQVTVNGSMTLNKDLTIEGDFIVSSGASITGTKEIKEVKSGGSLTNNGTISIKKIDKVKGTVTLNGSVSVTDDMKIEDNGSLTIGSSGSFSGKKLEVKDDGVLNVNGAVELSDKLKIKDDAIVDFNNGSSGRIEDIELEDDGELDIKAGSIVTVTNDLKVKDDAKLTVGGTITVEDDIEFKDDSIISISGVINLCDDDGSEGDNDFDVESGVTFTSNGTYCACSTNNDNNYNNNSNSKGNITFNQNCNGPLPIELGEFIALREKTIVILNWTTLSEINNDHFEIEVSQDGKHFEKVGQIKGQGNSNRLIKYSFEDFQPSESIDLYYRLKNVDFDGKRDYSEILFVAGSTPSIELDKWVKIYPTIVKPGESIKVETLNETISRIQLISLSGQVIELEKDLESNYLKLPTNLSNGIHFITVLTSNNKYSVKIVVQ